MTTLYPKAGGGSISVDDPREIEKFKAEGWTEKPPPAPEPKAAPEPEQKQKWTPSFLRKEK